MHGTSTWRFTGRVNWNGATEVALWHIHGGSLEAPLGALVTTKRSGFKTATDFFSDQAKVLEVLALDALGQVIARSDPVTAC